MSNTHQVPGSEPFPPEERRRKKRPFLVTLLALLVLFISCINLIRLIEAIRTWDFLVSLPGVSPLYIALTGLIWTLVGFPLAWGIWRGYPKAPLATQILVPVYALYYWFDRIIIAQTINASSNLLFAIIITVVVILLTFWTLHISKEYFRQYD